MTYKKELVFRHDQNSRIGILYCNLGTPKEPTWTSVWRYLAAFLSDKRVVEIPRPLWLALLYGVILPLRSGKSAAKYRSVWTPNGAPLRLHTQAQAQVLQSVFSAQTPTKPWCLVQAAMRYGKPSIAQGLDALKAQGAEKILIFSAYPQYSATTTASVWDAVGAWAARTRNIPELRFIKHYHDVFVYIEALAASVRQHWQEEGRAEHLLMSFHGMPKRSLLLGDPYHCECLKTGRLLAQALGLRNDQYSVAFQSRFGKAKWLEPYTEPSLIALAQSGTRSVEVICPGFSSDCLETLEEIAIEANTAFLNHGGSSFSYIPCLNADPAWMRALAQWLDTKMQDWLHEPEPTAAELETRRLSAVGHGATG